MEKAGVELVVEGLSAFVGGIKKANTSLKSLDFSGNAITRTLEFASNAFSAFGGHMLRVAEIALGVLVRDAFLAVINGLKEMISAIVEAGSEFQTLELRLKRLNLNTLMESGQGFTEAMRESVKMTREQMTWLQKLAVLTPYDAQDIANVFTLARSYGFAAEAAQGLTQDITDFASGMGLGSTEIERIIVNFGQMVQQGKVTQREMNDLARGSFVPVNDILKLMQENTGLTGKAFDKFRQSGEGVNAFMQAFSQLVKTRFKGAASDMARTFQGATSNAKDFLKSLIGFGIVTPLLDTLGGAIAGVLDSLTKEGNWERLTSAVSFLSTNLNAVFRDILGLGPDTSGIVDSIVGAFDRWGIWIGTHRQEILDFFTNLKDTAKKLWDALKNRDLGGFLEALGIDPTIIANIMKFRDTIVGVIDTIKTWVDTNGPTIEKFFETLGEIVGGVIENLTGMDVGGEGGGLQGFLDGVTKFMEYVIENKDSITEFATNLLKVWGALQVIGFVLSIVLPPLLGLVGIILSLNVILTTAISIFQIVAAVIGFLVSPIGLVILGIVALVAMVWWLATNWETVTANMKAAWQTLLNVFTTIKDGIINGWIEWVDNARTNMENLRRVFDEKVNSIKDLFKKETWAALGKAVMDGIGEGLRDAAANVLDTMKAIAREIQELFENIMDISSPSGVFADYGEKLMQGLARGIESFSGLAVNAMEKAAAAVSLPAVYATSQLGGNVSTQNNYTSNYNLAIHTSAPVEPIVQDYNMLKSLAGA